MILVDRCEITLDMPRQPSQTCVLDLIIEVSKTDQPGTVRRRKICQPGDQHVCPLIMVCDFALERSKQGVIFNGDSPFHRTSNNIDDYVKVPGIVRWLKVVDIMYCFQENSLSLYSVRRGGSTACEIARGGGDLQKYGEWNTAAYTRYDPSSGQNWQNRLQDILNAQYGA